MSGINYGYGYRLLDAYKNQIQAPQKEGIFYNDKTNKYIIRVKNNSRTNWPEFISIKQFDNIEDAENFYKTLNK